MTALGMVSPVGANAVQSFTSVRAEVCRKCERPDLHTCLADTDAPEEGDPLVASAVHHLDTDDRDRNRPAEWLACLSAQAYRDLLREARLHPADRDAVGLFMSLPLAHEVGCAELVEAFVRRFHDEIEQEPFPFEMHAQIGHSGSLKLCQDACRLLEAGTLRYAIVGGVDSYLFPERLARLDRDYRICSSRNVDGFCPGEAAAFFLIESQPQAQQRGLRPWLAISRAGSSTSTATPDEPNPGAALARMLETLLPRTSLSPLLVCDLNGETSRMKEWGFALARLGPALQLPLALEHPARCLGDVGAASGAALVALAARYLHTKHRQRESALVWAASDSGQHHAVLFERPAPPSGTPLHP